MECGSDLNPVVANIKVELKKIHRKKKERKNTHDELDKAASFRIASSIYIVKKLFRKH